MEFAVDGITEVVWQSSSFDKLVLSQATKDTVMALAEARAGRFAIAPMDDFVAGKGQGLNILLQCVALVRWRGMLTDDKLVVLRAWVRP